MARGPLTERLVRAARRAKAAHVVDLAAFRVGGELARELKATMMSKERADGLHPVHAFWSMVQHNLSMFGEQVLGLPEADRMAKLIAVRRRAGAVIGAGGGPRPGGARMDRR